MVLSSAYFIILMFGGGVEKSARYNWRALETELHLYHSCFHLSAFRVFLPKMIFGSSVLHLVVEPASDCWGYVGVEDTIEQFLMIHIVECSCLIERDKHCSVSRLFSWEAGSNVGSDRRQCMSSASAKSHVEQGGNGCVLVFWAAGAFSASWPLATED